MRRGQVNEKLAFAKSSKQSVADADLLAFIYNIALIYLAEVFHPRQLHNPSLQHVQLVNGRMKSFVRGADRMQA